jgi:hypothetical protein
VSWVCNKVADSGDAVIEKQGFSIFDRHGSAVAMPLRSFFLRMTDTSSCRNQILVVGRHQEVRRFVSSGLHHITSVSHGCRAMRKTYIDFLWFVSSEPGDDSVPSASLFRAVIRVYWDRYLGVAGKWWRGEEGGNGIWWELMH